MAERKTYRSLTVKMMTVVCGALFLAVIVFWTMGFVGNAVVNRHYLSERAVSTRLLREINSLRSFAANGQVSSTDINAIGAWNREHRYVQLTISGINATIKSDAGGAELVGNDYGIVIRSGDSVSSAKYPVNFRDGVFTVTIYDCTQDVFHAGAKAVSLFTATVVFLTVILIYDQHVTRTVQTLSRQVRLVSRGELDMQIRPISDDEIGQLALDVDTMRLSIIDKLQREEAAWQANSQLITAISHDVRTPLTALMGYLDIVSDESLTPQERQAYLNICKNNALRLKGLTDELFGFFLVFGKPKPDQSLEEVDACTLMDQILLEQEMNLTQRGFDIRVVHRGDSGGKLRVDVGHMRRIFDNLYSNVCKYADETRPVNVLVEEQNGVLTTYVSNYIKTQNNRVESNKIGLKTCEKLVRAMGGVFKQSKDGDLFSVEVALPLIQE